MQTIDDFIEYLVLGSVFLGSIILSAYLLIPEVISSFFTWLTDDISRITIFTPLIMLFGIFANQASQGLMSAVLFNWLLEKVFLNYERATLLANKARKPNSNSKKTSVNDVGDTLSWGRHLIFQVGSGEMNKQISRIYYAYRISYGSFFISIIPFFCSIVGFFLGTLTKHIYITALIGTGVLVLLSFVAARNSALYFWSNISYAVEVLVETEHEKFQPFLSNAKKKKEKILQKSK